MRRTVDYVGDTATFMILLTLRYFIERAPRAHAAC